MPARISCVFAETDNSYESKNAHTLTFSQEGEYFKIWKNHLIERSQISEQQFEDHFSNFKLFSDSFNDGTYMVIQYKFKLDWIEFKTFDKFYVEYNRSDIYPQHSFPRNELLDESWTKYILDNNIGFGVNFTIVDLSQDTPYRSCTQALKKAREKSGYQELKIESIEFYVPGNFPRENGQPYALLKGEVNDQENKCLSGELNLITGELEVSESVCFIN